MSQERDSFANPKGRLYLLALAAVGLSVVIFLIVSLTNGAGWTTYKSLYHSYSMDYPTSWRAAGTTGNDLETFYNNEHPSFSNAVSTAMVFVGEANTYGLRSLDDLSSDWVNQMQSSSASTITRKAMTVAGYPAVDIAGTGPVGSTQQSEGFGVNGNTVYASTVLTMRGGSAWVIGLVCDASDEDRENSVFQRMLSSFRFTQ